MKKLIKVNVLSFLMLFGNLTYVYVELDLLKLDSNVSVMELKLATFAQNAHINQILS